MSIERERLRQLLALEAPVITLTERETEELDGYVLERLRFEFAGKGSVRGFLARPPGRGPHPAVLYAHAHGLRYDVGAGEFLDGQTYLLQPALGPVFAKAGYVTLMIEMACFGERATDTESAASKALNWYGKSLIGAMLSDQSAALGWLAAREDVDSARIGAFGISMGCILSYWLAAIDERIAATAHLCCLADFATMIELGAHDLHGAYLTVPGLLNATSPGEIAGMIAPRPQLVCIGENDPLTPPGAWRLAYAEAERGYSQRGARSELSLLVAAGAGHWETEEMRAAVLDFFEQRIGLHAPG